MKSFAKCGFSMWQIENGMTSSYFELERERESSEALRALDWTNLAQD
jgi:hypothetical protein